MGRQSSLCIPVVSPHASKLFSVTQILIWKSQLTELTEDRGKKKKKRKGASQDPPSFFYCPFSFSLLHHSTDGFWWSAAAHPYFMSISHRMRQTLRNDYQGSESLIRRGIKTPPALWALDREARCVPRVWLESKITAVEVLMKYKLIPQQRYQLTMRICDNICVCTAVKLETVAPCLRKTCWEMFK